MSKKKKSIKFHFDFELSDTNGSQNICGPQYLAYMLFFEQLLISYISDVGVLNLSPAQIIIKEKLEEMGMGKESKKHCACLPSCTSIEYAFQTTQTDYHWRRFSNSENIE